MAEKKMTAAQKKAAAEAEAAAAAEQQQTERTRLYWAGGILAAIALFAGGYAVGNSGDDDTFVRGAFVEDDDRRGPFDDGDRRGPRGGFEIPEDFDFPEDFEFPHDFDFPRGPRRGFDFPEGLEFPEGFEFGPRGGFGFDLPEDFPGGQGFEFSLECNSDGECTFQLPEGFEFGEGFEFPGPGRRGDGPPSDEQPAPAFQPGFLGVGVADGPQGVVVQAVESGSPAFEAGIEPGDVFVSVDGRFIGEVGDLIAVVTTAGSGTEVEVVMDRDGVEVAFDVVLATAPA